ncbi:N-acetylmuramoyl-L-alanine amidase family protein [Deinococcus fonticola]|uniref:N-acetylmuramoyl-L-alanine amidase family protein n=1 Tax=Deinococcus fonticola TaxID=2528713 RepID=UPI001074DA0B|nr:N-acetylmuramoyl-L-alanine amidase [Deinococcus fonticola]
MRRWPRLLLTGALVLAGLAGAQFTFTKLNLAGQQVQSVDLYGAEYASQVTLGDLLDVKRDGSLVRVTGLGHVLLLPLDEDQVRATTDFNTVQLDAQRVQARTATWVNGNIYLPLDTLARGLGAAYQKGKFTLPTRTLQNVSSRAGKDTDRLVLDLSRDVMVRDELKGTVLRIMLKGTTGQTQRYTTRGAFIPYADVKQEGENTVVSFTLPQNSGYRVYPVVRQGGTRIVVDVGPGIPNDTPVLMERLAKPLIVLDPARVEGLGKDVTLEVARRSAELLTKAGWQVKLTREQGSALPLNEKLRLARASDVYLALDLGRFPKTTRGGVTVYENTGRSPAKFVNALRNGTENPPLGSLAVGDMGGTRRLSELLRGELKGSGVTARQDSVARMLTLSETAQAALLLEVGWAGNAQDRANLGTEARMQALSVSVARSVATYLTARANNASQVASAGAGVTP